MGKAMGMGMGMGLGLGQGPAAVTANNGSNGLPLCTPDEQSVTGMYDYQTPPGKSDIFFMYVYDATDQNLSSGQDYTSLGVNVTDGAFVCRAWNGAYSLLSQVPGDLGQIQIFGQNLDKWFDNPTNCYSPNPYLQCAAVLPEKEYRTDGRITFTLINTEIRTI